MTEAIATTPAPKIFIPDGSISLDKVEETQIRLGIQGPPKCGKTFGALSFPNCIVTNLDRGLGAHVGRSDIIEMPFYKPEFCDSIIKRDGINSPPNRRDAILVWLHKTAPKLTKEQTLIVDSNTQLDHAFTVQYNLNPKITKNGKIDEFGLYVEKIQYFKEICEQLKMLNCHVIYIAHETAARDKEGDLNGKVKPLMSGAFGDELASHFTDWFRCHAFAKPSDDAMKERFIKNICGGDKAMAEEFINSTPIGCRTIYLWQTQSDDVANCGTTSLLNQPKYCLANYSTFAKYRRKQNNNTTK